MDHREHSPQTAGKHVQDSVDEEWEDLPPDSEPLTSRMSSPSSSTRLSMRQSPAARKRKQFPAQKHGESTARSPPLFQRRRRQIEIPTDEWIDATVHGLIFALRYLFDVFRGSLSLLRIPLTILFFVWFLAFLMGHITSTIVSVLSPLCIVPGVSNLMLCHPDTLYTQGGKPSKAQHASPQWADYPKLMDAQTNTFEQLLDNSVGGSGLSLDIKKAEMATADLVTMVRFSKLTSKDFIAEALSAFVSEARRTGRGLQRLGSKVGGAVDQILAVNDYALHSIEEARTSSSIIRSLIPFHFGPTPNQIVLQRFTEAMEVLSVTIQRLIVEAEVQLANLEKLEESLTTLHELLAREDSSLSSAKSELLSDLWTRLGGNKRKLQGYDEHLHLLRGLGEYRKQALAHVVASLQTLRALSDDMEDMRERVTEPQLAEHISIDVHMKSISIGLQRLKDSRVYAREREDEAVRRILGAEHFEALEEATRK